MRRLISVLIISFFQLLSYGFINIFLQTMLNKLFRNDLYVLIILFLDIILPVIVFLSLNHFLCKKKKYDERIKNIILTNVLILIINVLYSCIVVDEDFLGLGLWIHSFLLLVISVGLVIFYSFKNDQSKTK